uniref:Replication-associated protein n=1 Tax=Vientovirus TaxID=2732655 RepID=A0A8G0QFR9_9VIRU|nr:replication-associated protein [Vientovirus]
MSIRLQHKNLYLTYLDPEKKIMNQFMLIAELAERLDKYVVNYGIACREVAPTTGTVHYHCLICCENTIITRNGKELLTVENITPHIQKVKGNILNIINYIKKEGNFSEVNKENAPKLKTLDKKKKAELMMEGNLMNLFLEGTLGAVDIIRAEKLRNIFQIQAPADKYQKKLILWFTGETGEGKTKTAVDIAEKYFNGEYWMSNETLKWFDGYRGQPVSIIDDFRKSMLTEWSFLLRLLDGYNLIVQVKGGFVKWKPKVIIVTSPASPSEAFQWINKEGEVIEWDKKEQLVRRLTYEDELQVYQFPLWGEDQKRLERTIRRFLGLPEEEGFLPSEEWSIIEPEGFITPG